MIAIALIAACILLAIGHTKLADSRKIRKMIEESDKAWHKTKNAYHGLHNHPITEEREGIPPDMVIVDTMFKGLFSQWWEYWDPNHVMVLRSEYENFKKEK